METGNGRLGRGGGGINMDEERRARYGVPTYPYRGRGRKEGKGREARRAKVGTWRKWGSPFLPSFLLFSFLCAVGDFYFILF